MKTKYYALQLIEDLGDRYPIGAYYGDTGEPHGMFDGNEWGWFSLPQLLREGSELRNAIKRIDRIVDIKYRIVPFKPMVSGIKRVTTRRYGE